MTPAHDLRILAMDVRNNRLGYALFDGPKRLFDWGGSEVAAKLPASRKAADARKRITHLLRAGHPTLIVGKRPQKVGAGRSSTSGLMLQAILHESAASHIPVYFITRKEIREAFQMFRASSRDDIAECLSRIFPELLVRLPPRRDFWHSEHRAMIIFDAISAGFAYWQKHRAQIPSAKSPSR